jgi:membrane protease YdiL (CAAX protease family)
MIFIKIKEFCNNKNLLVKAVCIYIVSFPFFVFYSKSIHYIFLEFFNIQFPYILKDESLQMKLLGTVLLAPIVETVVFQLFIIQILTIGVKKIKLKEKYQTITICVISAILFSIAHTVNHTFYPILIFPLGILLAYIFYKTYIKYDNFKAFMLTFYYHAVYNLSIIIFEYILP